MVAKWTPNLSRRDVPIYRAIAESLAADIEAGRLAPGARLPTHRELAGRLGVTIGTVTRAYAEAQGWGLIGGEVGRGTFVRERGASALPPLSDTPGEGRLIELGLNFPPCPPVDPVAPALARALEAMRGSPRFGRLLDYHPPTGLAHHRAAGAAWIGRFGLAATPAQVAITAGSQHAIAVVLGALTRPGDTVLVEALTYAGVKPIATDLHLRLCGVAIDEAGLLPDALDAACKTTGARLLYCVPNLQNPTGAILPEERRRRIVRIARARDLTIVEDDTTGLVMENLPPPLAAIAPERSYFIAGTSKLLAPGLRVAFVAAPEREVPRLAARICNSTWMAPPLSAEIAAQWIEDGTAEDLVRRRRREAVRRWAVARAILGARLPEGPARPPSYHVWLPLPGPWRGEAFAAHARRGGIQVVPAESFAVGPLAPPRGAVRVCLGAPPTRAELEEGLRRLARALDDEPQSPVSIV